MTRLITAALLVALLSGCVQLRSSDRIMLKELRHYGIEEQSEGTKSVPLAAALNILPGFGNIYLNQWGPFIVNLLVWPYSVVWGVPQAAIDAGNINRIDTVEHYSSVVGKRQLEKIKAEVGE